MSARLYDGDATQAERRRIQVEVNRGGDHPVIASAETVVPPETRILFCSPVAGVGISLFRTNVVINLASDIHQAVNQCSWADHTLEQVHLRSENWSHLGASSRTIRELVDITELLQIPSEIC